MRFGIKLCLRFPVDTRSVLLCLRYQAQHRTLINTHCEDGGSKLLRRVQKAVCMDTSDRVGFECSCSVRTLCWIGGADWRIGADCVLIDVGREKTCEHIVLLLLQGEDL